MLIVKKINEKDEKSLAFSVKIGDEEKRSMGMQLSLPLVAWLKQRND